MNGQIYGCDVDTGDEIGPITKAPDIEQVRAYISAWRRDGGSLGRFTDADVAGREGLGGPIVPGPMTLAFLSQLLTDWAGPLGRLRRLDVTYRRPIRHGDELRCLGLVTDTREEGDETVVRLDVFMEDARGDRPTQGVAEVVLPAKP
jgi:acyl dehydratase